MYNCFDVEEREFFNQKFSQEIFFGNLIKKNLIENRIELKKGQVFLINVIRCSISGLNVLWKDEVVKKVSS